MENAALDPKSMHDLVIDIQRFSTLQELIRTTKVMLNIKKENTDPLKIWVKMIQGQVYREELQQLTSATSNENKLKTTLGLYVYEKGLT